MIQNNMEVQLIEVFQTPLQFKLCTQCNTLNNHFNNQCNHCQCNSFSTSESDILDFYANQTDAHIYQGFSQREADRLFIEVW